MATEKQENANRENAQSSTGPTTDEGKQKSRMNAIKYGFFSKLLTEDEKKENEGFCNDIYDALSPANAYEAQLVEIMLSQLFSYRRVAIVENEMFNKALKSELWSVSPEESPYQDTVNRNLMDESLKFLRYKTTMLNLLFKTQHELERLTRIRNGETVSSPTVCDVNVSQ